MSCLTELIEVMRDIKQTLRETLHPPVLFLSCICLLLCPPPQSVVFNLSLPLTASCILMHLPPNTFTPQILSLGEAQQDLLFSFSPWSHYVLFFLFLHLDVAVSTLGPSTTLSLACRLKISPFHLLAVFPRTSSEMWINTLGGVCCSAVLVFSHTNGP